MSGGVGVLTFTVINATVRELLDRLAQSVITGEPAVFEATLADDFSDLPTRHLFEVQLQTLHLDATPAAADVLDQYERWFQIILHEDEVPIEFEIITQLTP